MLSKVQICRLLTDYIAEKNWRVSHVKTCDHHKQMLLFGVLTKSRHIESAESIKEVMDEFFAEVP